jgi:hypothetical protein
MDDRIKIGPVAAAELALVDALLPGDELFPTATAVGFVRPNAHGVSAVVGSGHEQPVPIRSTAQGRHRIGFLHILRR